MPDSEINTVQRTNTVRIDTHALSTLHCIRASMESATSVAVPGSAGIAMGIVGVSATALSLAPGLRQHWFTVWLFAAVIAAAAGGSLQFRPASSCLNALPVRRFSLCLFPSLFGGAVMTAILWSHGNHDAIPGTWLLLYGTALIPASVLTTSRLAWMGVLFMCLGIFALLLRDAFHAQMLLLGAGFGGLHLLFGFLIGRSSHGHQA